MAIMLGVAALGAWLLSISYPITQFLRHWWPGMRW
jgi:hypothetical protein